MPDALPDPERLAHELRGQGIPFVTTAVEPGTLAGTVARICTTILTYQYPLLHRLRPWPEYACRLESISTRTP